MSIQVNDFQWKPGENDAEYIRLLKRSNEEAHRLMMRATDKLVKMARTGKAEWISVEDKMPDEAEDVIVFAEWERAGISDVARNSGIAIGWQIDGRWHIDGKCRVVASHWMPLLKQPKEV